MRMRPVATPGQGTESRHVMQQARSPLAFTTILAQVHISDEMRQADRLSKDRFPKAEARGRHKQNGVCVSPRVASRSTRKVNTAPLRVVVRDGDPPGGTTKRNETLRWRSCRKQNSTSRGCCTSHFKQGTFQAFKGAWCKDKVRTSTRRRASDTRGGAEKISRHVC